MPGIQIKAVEDKVYLCRPTRPTGDESQVWILPVEEATSLLNGDALRVAIAQAVNTGKEARRVEIERLQARIRELQNLDKPIPDPNAPTIRKVKTMYETPA